MSPFWKRLIPPFPERYEEPLPKGLGAPVAVARGYNGSAYLFDTILRLYDKHGRATDVRLALIMSVDLELPARVLGDMGSITFSYQSVHGSEAFEIWIKRNQIRAFETLRTELYRRL